MKDASSNSARASIEKPLGEDPIRHQKSVWIAVAEIAGIVSECGREVGV